MTKPENSNPGGARFVGGALGSDPDYVVHHRGATHCRRRLPVSTASYAPRARRRTSLRLPAGRPRRAPHSGGRTEAPSTSLPQNAGGRHVRIAASPCAWLPPWLDEWFQHETDFDPSASENPGCTLPALMNRLALASSDVHRVDPRGASAGLVGKADNRGVVLSAHFTLTDHVCRPLQYGADAFYEAMSSSPHGPPLRLFRGPPRLLRSAQYSQLTSDFVRVLFAKLL